MPTFTVCLLVMLELLSFIASCHAEVRLTQDLLTVDIHEAPLTDVLNDLRHQGKLTIVAVEDIQIGNVKISKKFWNIPLEEGLDRLLSGWNYGISRNVTTGKVSTLYLVSLRTALPPRSAGGASLTTHSTHAVSKLHTQPHAINKTDSDLESLNSTDEKAYDDFSAEYSFSRNLPVQIDHGEIGE